MNSWLLVTCCLASLAAVNSKSARNLYSFQSMINKHTGRSAWDYNDYGNWCGFGGEGEPVDGVDKCCHTHDLCYNRLNRHECKGLLKLGTYFVYYTWNLVNNVTSCEGNSGDCARLLCQCDKAAAECFGANEYHPEFKRERWWNSWEWPTWDKWSVPSLGNWTWPSWG